MSRGGLLHAVSIGAFALLGLKVVGLWAGPPRPPAAEIARAGTAAPSVIPFVAAQQTEKPPLFGRALFGQRGDVRDPETTGSVDTPAGASQATSPATPGQAAGAPPATSPPAAAQATQPFPPPSLQPENRAGIFDGQKPMSASEKALYERLGERRGELEQRATDLDTREKLLQGVEKKLESSILDLKASEEKLLAVKKQETEATQTIKNLVTMYEVMKPKDAARVFDRLSHDVLVPVVLLMNPRKMAEVLAAMSPEAAEKLTVALAMRNGAEPRPTQASLPPNELPSLPR